MTPDQATDLLNTAHSIQCCLWGMFAMLLMLTFMFAVFLDRKPKHLRR